MNKRNRLIHSYLHKRRLVEDSRQKRRKHLMKKYAKLLLASTIVLTPVLPSVTYAVEDNIMGVPLQKFDEITNSSKKVEMTLEMYGESKELDGYKLKYMQDSYFYMYNILKIAEELGNNKTDVIPTHISEYNRNLKSPLTEADQIKAEIESNDSYIISTKSETAKKKLTGLIGNVDSEDEDTISHFYLLAQVRKDLGFTKDIVKGSTYEDSSISEGKMNSYLKDNISSIRLLMTATKEMLVDYKDFVPKKDHAKLSAYFVDTYDKIVKFSYDNDIEGLKDLDLLGERIDNNFTRDGEGAQDSLGKWVKDEESKEEDYILDEYSEYMLKNISASSTFRPFETSLNNIDAFAFLGEQNKLFHETFGTKRKMILTATDGYSDINNAINLGTVKNLKFMTLREFVKSPKTPKVLYLDNIEYTLGEVDTAQKIAKGDEEEKETAEDTELNEVAEVTETESKSGFWSGIWIGLTKAGVWLDQVNPFVKENAGSKLFSGQEKMVESIIFATADLSGVGNLKGNLKTKAKDVNEGYLIYTNILEEYYNKKNQLKMREDLDKPLYVDIYGNILSASGVVIIPAMSNPFMFKDDKPTYNFNRAYIESYPQYSAKDGLLKVDRKDSKKIALGMTPMNKEEISLQEELLDVSFGNLDIEIDVEKKENKKPEEKKKDPNADEEEISEESSSDLGSDKYGVIPGVNFHVTPAKGNLKANKYNEVNYLKPVANKFDNDYVPTKALDVWSFAKVKGSSLDSYDNVKSNVEAIGVENRRALIEEYTVKLSYAESDSGEVVSFLDIPDSKEIKRFMYITNLEHLTEIDGVTIKDRKTLDKDVANAITTEVYINGIYETNELNNLVPDFVDDIYDKYIEFLLSKSNSRYESVLGTDADNSILYSKSVEEVDLLKNILPLIYKIILVLAIASIIIYLIMTVLVEDSKWKQVFKIFTVLYIVTFLLNTSAFMLDTFVNKPTASMFAKESAYWTLVEQEKNTHLREMVSSDEVVDKEVEDGSKIKLYKIPYNYPYKMLMSSSDEGSISIDEFYEHYLTNDGRFRVQNNEMYVEGNYLVTDTKTIFDSSSVIVDDLEDVRLKLKHEVYYTPELAYYLPYYMFIDNIVYNLNALTEINTKVPNDLAYASGTVKTTGRIYNYVNSAMFLDYEEFLNRIDNYETSDKISEELTVASIKNVTETYGNPNDFLGIRKILNLVNEDEMLPFEKDGIKKVQNTGWYPYIEETLSRDEAKDFERRALKVNDKVKSFMMNLAEVSGEVSDEHLIKTIALYASLEFNAEFGSFASNSGPTKIELSGVPIERLLMALSVPRLELIDNSVTSYSNYIMESVGYWGLLLSSTNDMLIVFINYVKPFMMTFIWAMAGLIIFFKKVIIPDPNNRSILGSLKIMIFYILISLTYSLSLIGIIKVINSDGKLVVGQLLLFIVNIAYVLCLLQMAYALVRDGINMGNSVMLKGLEGLAKSAANVIRSTAQSVPLYQKYLGNYTDKLADNTQHLGDYFEQKSLRNTESIGDIGIKTPIDFGAKAMRTISNKVSRNRNPENFNRDNGSRGSYLVDTPNRRTDPNGYKPTSDSFGFSSTGRPINYAETIAQKEKAEIQRERKLKEQYVNANKGENQLDSIKLSYDRRDSGEDYLNNNRR